MQDRGFIIKIADILKKPGKKDQIVFEKKFTTNIQNLTDSGISGKAVIQSLDSNSVLVQLQDVKCTIKAQCDKCGVDFNKKFLIYSFQGKFILPSSLKPGEYKEDEDFFINEKDETIDIQDLVTQSIVMSYPVVWVCDKCQKNNDNIDYSDDEAVFEEFVSKNNIIWKNYVERK